MTISRFLTKNFFFLFYLFVQTFMRLLIGSQTSLTASEIASATLVGVFFDLFVWFLVSSPFRFLVLILPQKMKNRSNHLWITLPFVFTGCFFVLFVSMSEWNFWMEFHSRFNFIAVDYIIYSKEVLDNLLESFPMGKILSGLAVLSLLVTSLYCFLRKKFKTEVSVSFKKTLILAGMAPLVLFFALPTMDQLFPVFPQEQLSRNSYLEFYRAYQSNRISYLQYYKTISLVRAKEIVKFKAPHGPSLVGHKRPNVVLIIQESLGAKFIQNLGGFSDVTPNLNELAEKSMFFTRLYSTGTRTVRGLEALSLSVPPTPGYAVVKRPQVPGIASIGSVFTKQNYTKKFIYGGYGYFDNMNEFYENLGFDIVDKTNFKEEEITFSNAWGACDEDLYNKMLRLADEDYKSGKPFLHVALTTSNHRPFTYPDGKIDIPSGQERKGAVKYTDFAIGEFLKKAPSHPWFKNTIFVIVADHSTEGRGEFDLSMNDFHIPMWIYAPGFVKPKKITKLGSSVDVLPTLLSILGWNYSEPFFGHDLRVAERERAFIGNYQQVGYYENSDLVTLAPLRKFKHYRFDPEKKEQTPIADGDQEILVKGIAHYQLASWLLDNKLYKPINLEMAGK